jgi:hypothetical protein
MTMFDSINRPRWQHDNPEIRNAAIDELDDQAVLAELVKADPDPDVRAHALSRVSDSDLLDDLADTLSPPLQQQARSLRLHQLLDDPDALASVEDDTVLVRIASLSDDPELTAAAIGRIRSNDVRMDVAANHPVARVRLRAAQSIEDIGLLQQLAHKAKHKDKAVYRHCKDLLDKHHTAERAEAERQARIRQLAEDAQQLSKSVDSPDFKSQFQTLDYRWQSLKTGAGADQREQIQNALDVCAGRIEKIEAELATEEEQAARIVRARRTFPELIAELEALDHSAEPPQDNAAINALTEKLDGIEDRWLAALRYAKASAQQTKVCKKHLNQWRAMVLTSQRLLDRQSQLKKNIDESGRVDQSDFLALRRLRKKAEKLNSSLPWPESHDAVTPPPILQLRENLAQLEKRLGLLKKSEKQNIERMNSLFEELHKALKDNHVKDADRAQSRIRQQIRKLGQDQQQHFQHELNPLAARLREIHDWQGFAIEPKKIELCEQMKALGKSSAPSNHVATRNCGRNSAPRPIRPGSPARRPSPSRLC